MKYDAAKVMRGLLAVSFSVVRDQWSVVGAGCGKGEDEPSVGGKNRA